MCEDDIIAVAETRFKAISRAVGSFEFGQFKITLFGNQKADVKVAKGKINEIVIYIPELEFQKHLRFY